MKRPSPFALQALALLLVAVAVTFALPDDHDGPGKHSYAPFLLDRR